MSTISLQQVMGYRNENILSRFTDLFAVSPEEAEDIFTETKKFLFVSRLPGVFVPDELLILDEMWHNFILFTKEYQDFCTVTFGKYLHHMPASKVDKEKLQQDLTRNQEETRKAFDAKLATLISIVYDQLGQDTVLKWFQRYPEKYSKENIKALRKN